MKDLSPATASLKHFLDIVTNVEADSFDMDNVRATIRDKAWSDLPAPFKPKDRPTFNYIVQWFVVPQADGRLCIIKRYYVKEDKVKGSAVAKIIAGVGHEISWGTTNKISGRKALQWMLEQIGGTQFRHFLCPVSRSGHPTTAGSKHSMPSKILT